VVVWRHHGKQHKSFHGKLEEAREEQGRRRQSDERTPATKVPFEDHAREWVDTYRGRTKRGFSETSRDDYRRTLEDRVIPFWEGRKLTDIGRLDVKKLIRHLEKQRPVKCRACRGSGKCTGAVCRDCDGSGVRWREPAPASVVKAMVAVKALFADALDDELLRADPAARVHVNGTGAEESEDEPAKAMTRAQLARFIAVVDPSWRLFFDLLAETGLRVSEAIGLNCGDLQDGRLVVTRQCYRGTVKKLKTRNARRTLPLTADVAGRLWELTADRPPDAPMFTTTTGTRLSDGNVRRRVLAPAALLAEVDWIGFHTFRHTCASTMFDNGRNIAQVSKWLGHADPAFTLRTYVHLMDDGLGGPNEVPEGATDGQHTTREQPQTDHVGALADMAV
jgi:integrase